MEAIRRALDLQTGGLSQSMIARLIRNHDKEHRLEGFLKITQARGRPTALVRVLDDKLARYSRRYSEDRSNGCARGWCAVSRLACGKRRLPVVARAHVETIQLAEVGIGGRSSRPHQQRQASVRPTPPTDFSYREGRAAGSMLNVQLAAFS